MFGIAFIKNLSNAVVEDMNKMKGSLLLTMARRMPQKDAEVGMFVLHNV